MTAKGIRLSVLRDHTARPQNSTMSHTLSETVDRITVIGAMIGAGPGRLPSYIPIDGGVFEPNDDAPAYVLRVTESMGRGHLSLVPHAESRHVMSSGNFASTCDSRWCDLLREIAPDAPYWGAGVVLHDRIER